MKSIENKMVTNTKNNAIQNILLIPKLLVSTIYNYFFLNMISCICNVCLKLKNHFNRYFN